jgi:hypothetical protein
MKSRLESTGEGISARGNVFDLHRDDIDTRQSVAANSLGVSIRRFWTLSRR